GEALRLVGLEGLGGRLPSQLSGGQQQRVALARALAPEPVVLLLDEPLSNLDPSLRERTRREIRELIGRVGITTVLVTHEQEEAFDLGDRIVVLGEGRVEQIGTPDDLYNRPANAFVAGFIGRSSRLPVSVMRNGEGGVTVSLEDVHWRLPHARMPETSPAGRMLLLARPEAFRLVPPAPGVLRGTVTDRRFTGSSALFTVRTGGGNVIEVQADPGEAEVGGGVGMQPGGNGLHLYPVVEDGD
ncbi:MAG: ABC transporter ATP-binding protein, partial [Gemmatimonadales bacterium]